MPKRGLGPFDSARIRLRLLEEADLPLTLAWRNQEHIRKWFFNPAVITADQHRSWFSTYRERDDDFIFVIEQRDGGEHTPVGQVSLYRVSWEEGTAEYGRLLIGESSARGSGLAHEATARLLDVAFGGLGLREVSLEVITGNAPAIAIYQACGFTEDSRDGGSIRMTCTRAQDHRGR